MLNDYSHLKDLDRPALYKRLEELRPQIDFLMKLFNDREASAVAQLEFTMLSGSTRSDLSLFFLSPRIVKDTPGSEFAPPFWEFIHNLCTYYCGEKIAIETLIEHGAALSLPSP